MLLNEPDEIGFEFNRFRCVRWACDFRSERWRQACTIGSQCMAKLVDLWLRTEQSLAGADACPCLQRRWRVTCCQGTSHIETSHGRSQRTETKRKPLPLSRKVSSGSPCKASSRGVESLASTSQMTKSDYHRPDIGVSGLGYQDSTDWHCLFRLWDAEQTRLTRRNDLPPSNP